MTEVYLGFFLLLSFALLLYSLKGTTNIRIQYLILSAIVFGLAFNTKQTSLYVTILMISFIFFRNTYDKNLNFNLIKNKKFLKKSISLILLFISVSIITIVITNPSAYTNPAYPFTFPGLLGFRFSLCPLL